MEIRAAGITAFYPYDVAEQIDLSGLQSTLGAGASARLRRKTAAPTYLRCDTPPLVIDGDLAATPAGYIRAANQLHSLFIDVNGLTDRTESSLKTVGDIYAARVFTLAAARLGLDRWKQSVEDKLKTLDDSAASPSSRSPFHAASSWS